MRFSESIERLHTQASESRGLSDFGDDDYQEALEILCESLDEDASLTPIGEGAFAAMITDALEARLLVEEGYRTHPSAANTKIPRPLFIIGLPRTGTTALHHLISQDPSMQALEHWIQRSPQPRPKPETWQTTPDFLAAAGRLDALYDASPELRAIHEVEAHLPDECWNTFAQNFTHSSYEANADVHRYAEWWSRCDMAPTYRRHKRTAQLIGSTAEKKRWLFKDATHLFNLDALLDVYPDALIVQTHRDPVPVIASVCSLCLHSRNPLNQQTDRDAFGRSVLALWERGISAMEESRAKHHSAQFYDLPFERFVRDPVAAIRDVYTHFEMPFTESAESAITRFRDANPKGQHGTHQYTLEEWGLREGEVKERFSSYSAQYLGTGG